MSYQRRIHERVKCLKFFAAFREEVTDLCPQGPSWRSGKIWVQQWKGKQMGSNSFPDTNWKIQYQGLEFSGIPVSSEIPWEMGLCLHPADLPWGWKEGHVWTPSTAPAHNMCSKVALGSECDLSPQASGRKANASSTLAPHRATWQDFNAGICNRVSQSNLSGICCPRAIGDANIIKEDTKNTATAPSSLFNSSCQEQRLNAWLLVILTLLSVFYLYLLWCFIS